MCLLYNLHLFRVKLLLCLPLKFGAFIIHLQGYEVYTPQYLHVTTFRKMFEFKVYGIKNDQHYITKIVDNYWSSKFFGKSVLTEK